MMDLPFIPPVERISHPAFEQVGIEVWMKRDDMLHPFISGNKWRKLTHVLAAAKQQQCSHLVSFGGAYSNHLVALACAGAMYGFITTAFVRGEPVNNHMLNLCTLYGMNLRFVSREAYRDKPALYTAFAAQHTGTFFIDEGGRGELAALGCENIVTEQHGFTHVICACGTGTTLAGIARAAARSNTIAEGICVLKGAGDMDKDVADMAGFNVKIHHQFHEGGYAKTTPELLQFIKHFTQHSGILLDQVYTGKMMYGLARLVQDGYYEKGSKIMAVHTGGLLGMLTTDWHLQ